MAVLGVETLRDTVDFFEGLREIEPYASNVGDLFTAASQYDVDFSEVRGQEQANARSRSPPPAAITS